MALDAGKVVAVLELDTSGFSGGVKSAQSLISKLKDGSVSASDKLKAIGNTITGVGKQMTTALTLPLAAAGAAAVKTFSSFDDAMREVQATMGLTADNGAESIEKLTAAAKEMGATTKFKASEAAQALNYLALAGYDADKAISALPTVLKLAQAGGMDLGYASDLVTDSMSALGLEMGELTGFVDQLAKTSQKSNTNISQLGEAILTVGGTAKGMKGGTVELSTALGILADNGIKGTAGGTALRNILLALKNPTDDAQKALQKYNVAVYDSKGEMRGLEEIFADLGTAMAGWTQQQKDALFTTLFNARDLKSAEALLANYGDRWSELSGQIANAGGAATQMADAMEGGIGGSFRNLSSAVESLAISFGERLAPTVQSVADFVTNLARSFSQLPEATQSTIVNVAAFVAAMGPALMIGGKFITMLGSIGTFLTGPAGIAAACIAGAIGIVKLLDSVNLAQRGVTAMLQGGDPQKIAEYKEAFENIDAEIDLNCTVNDKATGTVELAVGNLRNTLKTITVLEEGESDKIVAEITAEVDPIIQALTTAGVDTKTDEGATIGATIVASAIALDAAVLAAKGLVKSVGIGDIAEMIRQDNDALISAFMASGQTEEEAQTSANRISALAGDLLDACNGIDLGGLPGIAQRVSEGKESVIAAFMEGGQTREEAETSATKIMELCKDFTAACGPVLVSGISAESIAAAATKGRDALIKVFTDAGVSEEEATAAADTITAGVNALGEACAGVPNIVPADIAQTVITQKSALVTSLSGLKLDKSDTASIIASYTTANEAITSSVSSIYGNIFDKLTDGNADTEEQKTALNDKVNQWFGELIGSLDLSTSEGASYAEALKSLQDETLAYIETMSGASTAAVQKSQGELEALEARARQLMAETMALTAEVDAASNNRSFRLVSAGVDTSSEVVAEAFGAADAQRKIETANAKGRAVEKTESVRDKWDKGDLGKEEYAQAIDKINAEMELAIAQAEATYTQNVNALLQGLGSATENAGTTAALEGIAKGLEDVNLMEQLAHVLAGGITEHELRAYGEQLTEMIQSAFFDSGLFPEFGEDGITADQLLSWFLPDPTSANQTLVNEGYAELMSETLYQKVLEGKTAAENKIKGMDTGSLGATVSALIESGLIDGIESTDMNAAETALNLLLGQLPIPDTTAAQETVNSYAKAIESGAPQAESATKKVVSSAASGMSNSKSAGATAGSNLGQGYYEGIGKWMGKIVQRAREMVQGAINAANSTQDSASPSKKAIKMGGWLGEGYALGIRSKISNVMSASMDMARAGLGELSQNVAGGVPAKAGASATGAGSTITLNVNNPVVRDDGDIRKITRDINRYTGQLQFGFGGR